MAINYEKQQVTEQKETNTLLWINTVFTVITGVASLVLGIIALMRTW